MSIFTSEIIRAQLTFHIARSTMDISGARKAAAQLDDSFVPVVFDHFAGQPSLPRVQLLSPPATAAFQFWPHALFRYQPRLGVADLPPEWVHAYLDWSARLNRSRQISKARKRMAEAIQQGIDPDTNFTGDPIVAGLLLFEFSPSPATELRRSLMKTALAQPLGGYLCAEALHNLVEREAILKAVAGDSLAVFGLSQMPEFVHGCLPLAASRRDLASGLVMARWGSDDEFARWLQQTGLAAFQDGAAACAMLVLQPGAPENLRAGWMATIQNPGGHRSAFDTVRWARNTWASSAWSSLRDTLKASAIHHGKCHWYNWFVQLEPEAAAAGLEMPADPLWSFELVQALNLDDATLRFRLADDLGRLSYLAEASLVLAALNQRDDLRREGGC